MYTHFQSLYLYFVYLHFQPMCVLKSKVSHHQHHLLMRPTFPCCIFLPFLPQDQLTVYTCIHLWAPVQFHWSIFLSLCQYHTVLHSIALWYVLKSESMRPPDWFIFLNFFGYLDLGKFHVNFRLFFHFCKNYYWVFDVDCIDSVTLFVCIIQIF